MPVSPEEKYWLSAEYTVPNLFGLQGDFWTRISYSYQSEVWKDLDAISDYQEAVTPEERADALQQLVPSYSSTTLQLGFTHDNGWETALVVRNLFDEQGVNWLSSASYAPGPDETALPGKARPAGTTLDHCSDHARSGCPSARSGDAAAAALSVAPRGSALASIVKLVTTSVVRGSHQGESHGGVYLIDLERRDVRQAIDWNTTDIDWQGRGWDRGLRGIAFDGEVVYIAASDELFAYTPDFKPLGSWRNPYLRHCHEIAVYERRLYLTSTGFDSILAFDLDKREFSLGAARRARTSSASRACAFDPREAGRATAAQQAAPEQRALHARAACTSPASRPAACCSTTASSVQMAAELPAGHAQRAAVSRRRAVQRYGGGRAALCRSGRGPGRPRLQGAALRPRAAAEPRPGHERDRSPGLRARIVHAVRNRSWPAARRRRPSRSTTSQSNERLLSVNLTMDVRNAIHGLAVWPYD